MCALEGQERRMLTKTVSRRVVLNSAGGALVTVGGALATMIPAAAGRKRKHGRKRKVTVRTGNNHTSTFDETNTSVVVGPDGPPGPDDVANS